MLSLLFCIAIMQALYYSSSFVFQVSAGEVLKVGVCTTALACIASGIVAAVSR